MAPSSHKHAWWICQKCKYSWKTRIGHRTLRGSGCPKCPQKSKMEKFMYILLTRLKSTNIIQSFEREWRPITNRRLSIDFCVQSLDNEKIALEMDGVQHFKPRTFGSKTQTGEQLLEEIQLYDQHKKDWCEENNVRLLRLSYKVKPKDYEIELLDFIQTKNLIYRMVGMPHKL